MKINETRMIKLRYLIAHKLPLFNSKLYHLMAQIKLLFQCRDTVVNISLSVTNAYMESISSPGDSTKVERFYVTKKVNTISLPQHRMKVERLVSHSLTRSHIFCIMCYNRKYFHGCSYGIQFISRNQNESREIGFTFLNTVIHRVHFF